jgi:hypothetical protein
MSIQVLNQKKAEYRSARLHLLEPAAWCALALFAAFAQLPQRNLIPRLYNDSFQYLSMAKQLGSSQRIETSLVYFDTARRYGAIPAPVTWFPPGYPLAIAGLSTIGLANEGAALVLSLASFVLVAAEIWVLMRMLDPSRFAARIAVFGWMVNAHALVFSNSALSESMFTAFGLASLLFIVYAYRNSAHSAVYWAGAAAMAGASYWVRYAGLLWVAACLVFLLWQVATSGNKRRAFLRPAILAVSLLVLFLTPLLLRNMILAGDPRGGNNTPVARPFIKMAMRAPGILYHLIMGNGVLAQLWFFAALLAAGLIVLGLIAFRAGAVKPLVPARQGRSQVSAPPGWAIVLAALLIYFAGITAIAARTPISYTSRMFLPMLPHCIALALCGLATLMRRVPAGGQSRTAFAAVLLCALPWYTMSNVLSRASIEPDNYQRTVAALLEPDDKGHSLKEILGQELKPGEVIAATNGQALGYVLGHPTLALAGRPFTLLTWNAPELRAHLARYGANHLLIFRSAELAPVTDQSPFLQKLAAGQPPSWLRVAAFNRDIYLYQVELDSFDAADESLQ